MPLQWKAPQYTMQSQYSQERGNARKHFAHFLSTNWRNGKVGTSCAARGLLTCIPGLYAVYKVSIAMAGLCKNIYAPWCCQSKEKGSLHAGSLAMYTPASRRTSRSLQPCPIIVCSLYPASSHTLALLPLWCWSTQFPHTLASSINPSSVHTPGW